MTVNAKIDSVIEPDVELVRLLADGLTEIYSLDEITKTYERLTKILKPQR